MNHPRSFGIELEITGLRVSAAARALRAAGIRTYDANSNSIVEPMLVEGPVERRNVGCNCNACYDAAQRNLGGDISPATAEEIKAAWRVVEDGSVSNGCEVVSPILSGNEGLDSIRKIVAILKDAGAEVDESCGFHVHVNANDFHAAEIVNAVKRYARFETEIDSFNARRRRGSASRWCRSMDGLAGMLDNEGAMFTATQVAQKQEDSIGRYLKLNTAAFLRHGTIEFRQHAGTLNISKIVNWVVFCVNFMENSRLDSEFLASYDVEASKQKLVAVGRKLAAVGRWGIEIEYLKDFGVSYDSVPALIDELVATYPEFTGTERVNTKIFAPNRIQGVLDDVRFVGIPLPEGRGLFDNMPQATVDYLNGRATGYGRPLASLAGRIRSTASGLGF